MRRIIISLALAAAFYSPSIFAQSQTDFRSVSSGVWTDSQIWQQNEAGVRLASLDGVYPGERHNRDADVMIGDGSTVTIGKDEVVEINSLSIFNGRVVVEGTLIVGAAKNDPPDP